MKSERNILIAFILNLLFSVFEYIGAALTGSVAIMSDAVHDTGDALSIGISYFLEKKSKKRPDEKHTYGYARYSVIGGVITTIVLLVGSFVVIHNAVSKIISPAEINYDVMLIFALVGVVVNLSAAYITRKGKSVNQRAVNLHMLEDVFGWIAVLIGAVVMRFTDLAILDPLMSIGVALFIIYRAVINLKEAADLFLEKTPFGISVAEIKEHITKLDGVLGVHHIHIWSLDGQEGYATMHIVTDSDSHAVKEAVRSELKKHGIVHATLELEKEGESCCGEQCNTRRKINSAHHH